MEEHYSSRRPSRGAKGIRLLHDNARPYKAKVVSDMIASIGMIELPYPLYSPDLSPCDFWLFSYVKKQLAGKVFDTRLALGLSIPQEEFKKTFTKWIERLKLCVLHKGEYFEHTM